MFGCSPSSIVNLKNTSLSDGETRTKVGEMSSEEEITGKIEPFPEESGNPSDSVLQDSDYEEFYEFGDKVNEKDQKLFKRRKHNYEECGQSFAWLTGLVRHQHTHCGKAYECGNVARPLL